MIRRLTAEATWADKVLNAAEDVFASSCVKGLSILNSKTIFGSAGGAGVVAASSVK